MKWLLLLLIVAMVAVWTFFLGEMAVLNPSQVLPSEALRVPDTAHLTPTMPDDQLKVSNRPAPVSGGSDVQRLQPTINGEAIQ